MSSQSINLSITKGGKVKFIYTDELADLIDEGVACTITRVSHVEPYEDGWHAVMNDGTDLGPFRLRQGALDAEVAYLEKTLFGK